MRLKSRSEVPGTEIAAILRADGEGGAVDNSNVHSEAGTSQHHFRSVEHGPFAACALLPGMGAPTGSTPARKPAGRTATPTATVRSSVARLSIPRTSVKRADSACMAPDSSKLGTGTANWRPTQNSGRTVRNLRPFAKGVSGNPGGCPRVLAEIRALARTNTEPALLVLVEIMQHGQTNRPRGGRASGARSRLGPARASARALRAGGRCRYRARMAASAMAGWRAQARSCG